MTKINKIYLKVIFSFLLILTFSFTPHKEYYSLTKIDYNQKEKSLQISMRVFIDDMEYCLNNQYNKVLELGTKRELSNADQLIKQYLIKNFEISINKKQASTFQLLGKEYEKDALYLYLEIKDIDKIESIYLRNSTLIESFPEQENIVKFNINEQYKSLILTSENDRGMLKFL